MSFTLDSVIPWGRSLAEYKLMFSLTNLDLNKKVLGCGDGPASFNAELVEKGGSVVSIDPIYQFTADQIELRVRAVYEEVLAKVEENKNEFVWGYVNSVDHLGEIRMFAMKKFLSDYQNNKERYINSQLPVLPFKNSEFELALCSHFLFLYSQHHTLEFHIESLKELSRVADEVRIFPLLELGSKKSRHLNEVITYFRDLKYYCAIEKVKYEFQKGGNEMLVLKKMV
ncbi:MAG: hypothetical protein NE328_15580 [Lentisphaeraceae bacterium]|nr:hypothetical protein [Lentisphaeraceae bacterium]